LLVIAENVEGDALATLILNRVRGTQLCAIKSPGFGDSRRVLLQDLAVLTGGQVISDELGLKLENIELKHFGTAKKVVVTQDDTIILSGGGEKDSIEERCEMIRSAIANTESDYEITKLKERLAKLAGGVALLKVGGASDVEVGEKKDRITDALNATQAAVAEGIVPGGGTALLYASQDLDPENLPGVDPANMDQKTGAKIIKNALTVPIKAIANNAGVDGAVVVGKLLDFKDREKGYNAATGVYENMYKAGIIDPTKVVRTALVDAAGVASIMTTTEAMVVELPDTNPSQSPMGGMGGMGGMGMGGMGGLGGMY